MNEDRSGSVIDALSQLVEPWGDMPEWLTLTDYLEFRADQQAARPQTAYRRAAETLLAAATLDDTGNVALRWQDMADAVQMAAGDHHTMDCHDDPPTWRWPTCECQDFFLEERDTAAQALIGAVAPVLCAGVVQVWSDIAGTPSGMVV